MKRTYWGRHRQIIMLIGALAAIAGGLVVADLLDLTWYTIDAGGGTVSTGSGPADDDNVNSPIDTVELVGTIGQPDAGVPMIGTGEADSGHAGVDEVEIVGGFWSAPDGAGDCNKNGRPDNQDINCINDNTCGNLPPSSDCNANGIPDECDVANGLDCDGNSVPDLCDLAACVICDCNNNDIPDSCDIAVGSSLDVNPDDDVPDECKSVKWNVNMNGSWTEASKWAPPVVPSNMPPISYLVTIDRPTAVTVTGPPNPTTIQTLSVGGSGSIDTLQLDDCLTVNDLTSVATGGTIILGLECRTPLPLVESLDGSQLVIENGGIVSTGTEGGHLRSIGASVANHGSIILEPNRDLDLNGQDFTIAPNGMLELKSSNDLTVKSTTFVQQGIVSAMTNSTLSVSNAEVVNTGAMFLFASALSVPHQPIGLRNEPGGSVFGAAGSISGNVLTAGQIEFQGDLAINGDLTIVGNGLATATGDFVILGAVEVADNAEIDIDFDVTLKAGGSYGPQPEAVGPVTATLVAQDVSVARCAPMTLQDAMTLTTTGNLTVGVDDPTCAEGVDPPIIFDDAVAISVAGNFTIAGSITLTANSTQNMIVSGNFVNLSVAPGMFDWSDGGVTVQAGSGLQRTFEVAGGDLGAVMAGFENNFAMGRVEIGAGANVKFQTPQANTTGGCEALYVNQLTFGPGSTVTIDACKVYYNTLAGNGVTPTFVGCGSLSQVPTMATIVSANPPTDNPFLTGQQPFRDVLQTGTTPALTQGIGAAGTPAQGTVTYASISAIFSAAPAPSPAPGNITIACNGTGPAPCPTATSVTGSGSGPYMIMLSGPIPPRNCTTLTFPGTAAGQKLQYQYLPGDVNLSGTTSATDIAALVNALSNGQAALPANLPRYNINRLSTVGSSDLLRLVGLLNGVNTTQVWTSATVATCP